MTPSTGSRRAARLLLVFSLGLACAIAGESLLFLEKQSRRVEQILLDDFRVLAFAKPDVGENRLKVLQEKLRALPYVEEARYVSRDEALSALRRGDPEFVESIALLGENPLQAAYELRLAAVGIGGVAQWADQAYAFAEISDIRYKPGQIHAILQAQFYAHFIALVLSVVICLAAIVAAVLLWAIGPARLDSEAAACAGAAAAAAVCGLGLTYLFVLPLRDLYSWWAWPSALSQVLLVLAAAAGGLVMAPWKQH